MILALLTAAVFYTSPPAPPSTYQCFALVYRDYKGFAGSAILSETSNLAIVMNSMGIRVATMPWDHFVLFLDAQRLRAVPRACNR